MILMMMSDGDDDIDGIGASHQSNGNVNRRGKPCMIIIYVSIAIAGVTKYITEYWPGYSTVQVRLCQRPSGHVVSKCYLHMRTT